MNTTKKPVQSNTQEEAQKSNKIVEVKKAKKIKPVSPSSSVISDSEYLIPSSEAKEMKDFIRLSSPSTSFNSFSPSSPTDENINSSTSSISNLSQPKINKLKGLPKDEDSTNPIISDEIDNIGDLTVCPHHNFVVENGTKICEDCGVEIYQEISHNQEWHYFADEDSGEDPSRCQFRKSSEKGIKKDLLRLGFPPDICLLADRLYMDVTKGEIKRNDLRKNISFACTFESYKMKGKPRTPESLQKKFGVTQKGMSRGIAYYRERCPREYFQTQDITARDFIPEIMKKMNCNQEHIDVVTELHEKIKDASSVLKRSNPQSVSKALVYYYFRRKGCNVNLKTFSEMMALGESNILRISGEISRILGTVDTVDLF